MNQFLSKIAIGGGLLFVGYITGALLRPCELPREMVRDILSPTIVREVSPDSVTSIVPIQDSGKLLGKAMTTTEGRKSIKATVKTGITNLNVDIEYDPRTDDYQGTWSYVAIRDVVHYYKSIYERVSYPTVQTVVQPDTDDWQWFGIGGAGGVALSIIVFLLLAL